MSGGPAELDRRSSPGARPRRNQASTRAQVPRQREEPCPTPTQLASLRGHWRASHGVAPGRVKRRLGGAHSTRREAAHPSSTVERLDGPFAIGSNDRCRAEEFAPRHAPELAQEPAPKRSALSGQDESASGAGSARISQSFPSALLPHPLLQCSTCCTPSFPDHPLTTTDERVVGKLRGAQQKGVGGGGVKRGAENQETEKRQVGKWRETVRTNKEAAVTATVRTGYMGDNKRPGHG